MAHTRCSDSLPDETVENNDAENVYQQLCDEINDNWRTQKRMKTADVPHEIVQSITQTGFVQLQTLCTRHRDEALRGDFEFVGNGMDTLQVMTMSKKEYDIDYKKLWTQMFHSDVGRGKMESVNSFFAAVLRVLMKDFVDDPALMTVYEDKLDRIMQFRRRLKENEENGRKKIYFDKCLRIVLTMCELYGKKGESEIKDVMKDVLCNDNKFEGIIANFTSMNTSV